MSGASEAAGGIDRTRTRAAQIFACFAAAYFLSALLRASTATLAPVFRDELALSASELGLLAGAYFLGFAAMQLPLGSALDRFGPKPVQLGLLAIATLACTLFAQADGLAALVLARLGIGIGVSASLMAPLTCYRLLWSPQAQMRANSWMLMTGSLGMLASTLPVQALLPLLGWRGVFWALAGGLALSLLAIGFGVPAVRSISPAAAGSYRDIARDRLFRRLAPAGFFVYGGLIAVQALWAGPWMTKVCGRTAQEAAQGLFLINGCMLFAFLSWGLVLPKLVARGFRPLRLLDWGLPFSCAMLVLLLIRGSDAGAGHWAAWCVLTSVVNVSQPAVAQQFRDAMAGRALSAYNLVIFAGVFALQWGIGLLVDVLVGMGLSESVALRVSFGAFAACCAVSTLWWFAARAQGGAADNSPQP